MEFLEALDLGSLFFFETLQRPWLDAIMSILTHAGDTSVLSVVALLALVGFSVMGKWRSGVLIVVALLQSWAAFHAVKLVVYRPRPDVAWAMSPKPTDPGFPSGHTTTSIAVYGFIALSLIPLVKRRVLQSIIAGVTVVLVLAIGFTRMYLGWLYLTDVVGGWALGLSLALLLRWLDLRWSPVSSSAGEMKTPQTTRSYASGGMQNRVE